MSSKFTIFVLTQIFSFLFIFLSHGSLTEAQSNDSKTTKIGAIIDANSRIGKEQKLAMEIAAQNFNSDTSNMHKLVLHFKDPGRDPLQAVYAAEELIKEEVQVIVRMETWHEAAIVASIGNREQVPILSLASAATISPPSTALRWPFLVQIATNGSQQVNCITSILQSYKWKKVIAIYEDDTYGSDSSGLALLFESLHSIGIEHRLVFPPFSTLSDPQGFVHKEFASLFHKQQSRVFIVLQSSLPLAIHLFREAKQLGLVGRDSVWIITDAISSLLDSVNSFVISDMQGALGIQAYYPESNQLFQNFKQHFQKKIRLEYREEDNSEPGIHAIRAYDSIDTIIRAVQKLGTTNNRTQKMLLENILSSDFKGLSGDIRFDSGELSYNEVCFWSSKFGFSESVVGVNGSDSMKLWAVDSVNWPGKLVKTVPKGWAMPSEVKKLKIGVPAETAFEMFVKVVENSNGDKSYLGLCIEVFEKVVEVLVGDITILADRFEHVDFTQLFLSSGLTMIVPVKIEEAKAWIFIKPFNKEMWIVTALLMIYTMFVVWFLEHQSNPEFRGPWKSQLSTTLWFTFSSLFFAQREKIYSNYTKVVVAMWLFVVFVVTSSYTASLTSMLTVPRLQPTVTDIEFLRRTNATVGCDGDSFVKHYLLNVLQFKKHNIKASGNIAAAFLEPPYAKIFLRENCNNYTVSGPTYIFGGWGFAFQKGSPIAIDVSKAILTISEIGDLKKIREKWSKVSSSNCSNVDSATKADSLNLQSFWGLYLISGITSTICFMFFLIHILKNYRNHIQESQGNTTTPSIRSLWRKMFSFAPYFHNGGTRTPGRAPTIDGTRDVWSSRKWELVSPSEIPENSEVSRSLEIEIPVRIG
ncbi:hypothetical protein ACSBR2_014527 [Camellia fascicularis]